MWYTHYHGGKLASRAVDEFMDDFEADIVAKENAHVDSGHTCALQLAANDSQEKSNSQRSPRFSYHNDTRWCLLVWIISVDIEGP